MTLSLLLLRTAGWETKVLRFTDWISTTDKNRWNKCVELEEDYVKK